MREHYYTWSSLLKTESQYSKELKSFESSMVELYGANVFDVWTRWSEKLQALGLYK
jgi:hypothetical protein